MQESDPPPIAPKPKQLPFYAPQFTWETFEGFFCDFLASGPELVGKDGKPQRIVSTSLYGRKGDSQHGIDIRAEMAGGEVWVFQCKHYKKWGPQDTEDAVSGCTYQTERKFLLVTRPVSSQTRDVIATHSDWDLWDSDDISREFFARLPMETAARLLYSNFGPAWPKEMLGLGGSGPFCSAEAKFAPLIEEGRTFHHRLQLIGRRDWLQALDAFVGAEQHRVFLFSGRGGLGKSRILREWSRDFSGRHSGWTLKFISDDDSEGFGPAIDACAKPLLLVFDDAHRFDEMRRELFGEMPSRKDVKLVLSLRPGPIAQMEVELTDAGFDVSHIERPAPLQRLSSEQALELAEEALGEQLSDRHRHRLRHLSRDSPLLAVLAAELLKSGRMVGNDLSNDDSFRVLVFEGLIREADPVKDRFGESQTTDFLRLLAVLSPVDVGKEFKKQAAKFLGSETRSNEVGDLIDALDRVGLLISTGAGIRVTPDLLSDHLAYTACYDKTGHDTTFVERVFEHFSPSQFPRLLQHVAEAEWRAMKEIDSAESVIEPLWNWFLERFRNSCFFDRHRQLDQWANVAHLQPTRTLELAKLAVFLWDAPPSSELQLLYDPEWQTHRYVLSALPNLLKPLALSHPEFIADCLDILWMIGKDRPLSAFGNQGHPIITIGEIARYDGGRFPYVQREVLAWIRRFTSNDEWLEFSGGPAWLLLKLVSPFYATIVEQHWNTGRVFHLTSAPVHIDNTAEFREGVITVCRSIIARNSVSLTLAVLDVVGVAIQPARLLKDSGAESFQLAWLKERRKTIPVMTEIASKFVQPIIQYKMRSMLRHVLHYDQTEFRADCRPLFEAIPGSLDLNVFRTVLSGYHEEFARPREDPSVDWQEEAKRHWDNLVNTTVDSLVKATSDPIELLSRLAGWERELKELGYVPKFGALLNALAIRYPELSIVMAENLISGPEHSLAWGIGILILSPTSGHPEQRIDLVRRALERRDNELAAGAIECLAWWRREEKLPEEAWGILASTADRASARVAHALTRFIRINDRKAVDSDWQLLASLPSGDDDGGVVQHILDCSEELLRSDLLPTNAIADAVISKLDHLTSLDGFGIEGGLIQFAIHFPGKVFLLFWRRYLLRKDGRLELKIAPGEVGNLVFGDISSDPEAASALSKLEEIFLQRDEPDYDGIQILNLVVNQRKGGAESELLRLLNRATTAEQMNRLVSLIKSRDSYPTVLEYPEVTRAFLKKSLGIGRECHKNVFDRLLLLPGGRGFENSNPDEDWTILLNAVEAVGQQFADDPELGSFYSEILKSERDQIKHMQKRGAERDLDEEW